MLYIVSTPIGNLKDISYRAIEILKEVDIIAAEDTRRTGKLLKNYGISAKMLSFNDFNKVSRTRHLVNLMQNDQKVALVSDSGTPGVSDPGFYLVRECVNSGVSVSPIPGANAAISALVCSGLPTDKFGFFGFLPKKHGKLVETITAVKMSPGLTFIYYESPYRILKSLKVMNEVIPDRQIVIAREMTKIHEEFIRGRVSDVYKAVSERKGLKGELVVVLH